MRGANMKKVVSILSILAAVLCGCAHQDETVIRIGAAGPMTGSESKMGLDLKNGVELAVSEWNTKGGILGKRIELVVGDDAADPKQAVSIANKFVNQKVDAVVGHWNSNCSINASKFYNDANIVMVSPATTNPRLTLQGYKTVFRVCGTDEQQGNVAAQFVLKKLKIKRVAVLHDQTTYGRGLADIFKNALGDKVQVVYYGGIAPGDPDYKAVLTAVKERKPELYFFGGVYPEAGRLVRQAQEIGMNILMMTGDGVYDPTFMKIAGKAAEGTYVTFGKEPMGLSTAMTFMQNYRAKYGEPGPYSIYAYDAANIILTAFVATGTTNGVKVAGYISSTVFHGAFGDIAFDNNGDVKKAPYVMWQVQNGQFKQISN